MPKYVVVDSQDKWLEVGEYDTPEEALAGGLEASYIDNPLTIYVYEIIVNKNPTRFFRNKKGLYEKQEF